MSRYSNAALLVAIGAMLALVACTAPAASVTSRVDVYQVQPCDREDGSGDAQAYPCVWDENVTGSTQPYAGAAFILYVQADCPVPTVQPDVRCVDVREWMRPGS